MSPRFDSKLGILTFDVSVVPRRSTRHNAVATHQHTNRSSPQWHKDSVPNHSPRYLNPSIRPSAPSIHRALQMARKHGCQAADSSEDEDSSTSASPAPTAASSDGTDSGQPSQKRTRREEQLEALARQINLEGKTKEEVLGAPCISHLDFASRF